MKDEKKTRAEEALKESETKYRNLIESVNQSIISVDLQGNLLTLNNHAVSDLGGLAEDYIGKTLWDISPKKVAEERFAALQKVIQSGKPVIGENYIPFKGKTLCFLSSMQPVKNRSGDIYAVLILASDITKQKQAEAKLKDSEEYLQILFDYAPDAYYISDLKDNFIDCNKEAERLTGYKKEELIGKNFLELKLFSTNDLPKVGQLFDKNLGGLSTGEKEFVLNKKDNSSVTVEISSYTVKIKGRTLALGIIRDITARKKAEKALTESEERYRTVFENTGTATLVIEEDQTGSMVNTQCEKLSGYSKEEIENKMKWTDFIIPEDLERMKKYHIDRRKAGGKAPTEYEFRMMDKKGNIKDIFMKIGMMPNTKKSVASLTDITERKKAEIAIVYEQSLLHALMDNIPDFIYFKDEKNRFVRVNKTSAEDRGVTPEDFIGKTDFDIFTEEAAKKCFADDDRVMKTGKTIINSIEKITYLNGMERWFSATKVPRYDEKGKIIGTIGITRDITEGKLAEDSIKNAKDELQMIMDSVPAIIFYKNTEGKIIRTNKAMADLLKLPIRDIIGKTSEEIFPMEQAENMIKDDLEIIISGKPKRGIIQSHPTPEGIRFLMSDKIPCRDIGGKITGVIVLAKDITKQRKSEQELQQTFQKLKKTMDASIDTMSNIIEAKDPYTAGHQRRVSQLATAIAKELHLSQDKVEGIRIASLIHDIGKIGLPTEILSKPTRLNDIEFSLIKEHPQIGYDILKSVDFSYPVAKIALQHHEKLDGSGYPNHLKGDVILFEAKIICVADVVEAMSSHRPYRPALGIEKALEEISQNKGTLYDPEAVDTCLKLFKEKGFKFE